MTQNGGFPHTDFAGYGDEALPGSNTVENRCGCFLVAGVRKRNSGSGVMWKGFFWNLKYFRYMVSEFRD